MNVAGEDARGWIVKAAFASDECRGVYRANTKRGAVGQRFNRQTGVAVEAGRKIDGEDLASRTVDRVDGRAIRLANFADGAGAEQRIDDVLA